MPLFASGPGFGLYALFASPARENKDSKEVVMIQASALIYRSELSSFRRV
jgi:hypothetical protein